MRSATRERHPGPDALRDLRDVLQQTGPAIGLPLPLLRGLQSLLRCDHVSFRAVDSRRQSCSWSQDLAADQVHEYDAATGGPPPPPELLPSTPAFWRHYWDFEPCSHPDRAGVLGRAVRISDFLSQRQWHASPMYREYFAGTGLQHHLTLALPGGGEGRTVRLLLGRCDGPDFDDFECFLVELLRPHLLASYRRARTQWRREQTGAGLAPSSVVLTSRQRQVLTLVRDGATDAAIARRLDIAEGTVRKHLERIRGSLGVSSRTAAVTAVRDLL